MPASASAESLFFAALDLPPDDRHAFLDTACGGDTGLRERIEKMLAAQPDLGEFLDRPAVTLDPALLRGQPTHQETSGAVVAGRYELARRIGEGGMGSVWLAEQRHPVRRRVAVKLIRGEFDGSLDMLARFSAERQAIALMDHPNVAKLLEAGTTGEAEATSIGAGRPYFVMEFVDGAPLNNYCDTHKLTVPDRLRLFVQICRAVQHAHQKGVIHRDLKPSNILVEHHGGRPVPRVIDFGLAKATGGARLTDDTLLTLPGNVAGTPLYMAPEQADLGTADIDTRADVYALGVNLYELLTGTTPIEREQLKKVPLVEMLHVIRDNDPPTPSQRLARTRSAERGARNETPAPVWGRIRAALSFTPHSDFRVPHFQDLDLIVMKALAKERDRRYESASAFAADVERFLNHEPVVAGPPTAVYRLRKFVRRHRIQVEAAGLVLLALLLGLVGTTVGLFQANLATEAQRLATIDANEQKEKAIRAAAAEKEANERTQKRLAQIERGVELFADLLTGINPRAEDKEAKPLYDQLRERAERAADQLQAEEVSDPRTEARLQTLLGKTLLGLGGYAKAVEVLERARATRERELGPDHPDTLVTLDTLASAYLAAGRIRDAIPLFERVRDASVATVGADHPDTLATLSNLAGAYLNGGRADDALPLYERVRDALEKTLGADHPTSLTTSDNLATTYRAVGRMTDAIRLYERVRDVRQTDLGAEHPVTLKTLHNLAVAYRLARRTDDAITLLEQVRDVRLRKLGAEDPDTLKTLGELAGVYRVVGRMPDAVTLLERVRDAQEKKLGGDHPDTLATVGNLAGLYLLTGRADESVPLFERVRDAQETTLGADHPDTLNTLGNLAGAYSRLNRLDKSIPVFEELLTRREKKLTRQHPDTISTAASLGVNYRDAGRLAEAIPLLEEAYRAAATHPTFRGVGPHLLETYRRAEKPAAATKLIAELLADARKLLPADSPQLAGALAHFGLVLLEAKGYVEAEPLLRESLAIREKRQPEAWTTFDTTATLGGALLGQKKHADAEPLLLKGCEGMKAREKTIPPQASGRIPDAIDRLVALYTATDKSDEAARWRTERAKYPAATPPKK